MDIYVGVDWDRKKAIEQLDVVCRQLAQVEGQLEERLAEDEQAVLLRSMSGVGLQLSANLLGLQAVRHLPWAQAMYAAGRKRGLSAGTAFRRVSRSLLRILTAMLRDGQVYDEARYVRALLAKGVHWAQEL